VTVHQALHRIEHIAAVLEAALTIDQTVNTVVLQGASLLAGEIALIASQLQISLATDQAEILDLDIGILMTGANEPEEATAIQPE
jgi:hypothetical protein